MYVRRQTRKQRATDRKTKRKKYGKKAVRASKREKNRHDRAQRPTKAVSMMEQLGRNFLGE